MKKLIFIRKKLIIYMIMVVFLFISYKAYIYSHYLSFIPNGMGVWHVLYAKEDSWGFGPGGNESGAISYSLPNDSAEKIEKGGAEYLSTLKPKLTSHKEWQGIYLEWYPTPIREDWVTKKVNLDYRGGESKSGIAVYLYNMGFKIDPNIEKEIDQVATEPGNFYAHGRVGIIVVAPKAQRVFYVYSG